MSNDKIIGGGMLAGSLIGIGIYAYLLWDTELSYITLRVSAFLAVTAILLIVAWIGYTLATTPPPVPLDDLNFDFDDDNDNENEDESSKE